MYALLVGSQFILVLALYFRSGSREKLAWALVAIGGTMWLVSLVLLGSR